MRGLPGARNTRPTGSQPPYEELHSIAVRRRTTTTMLARTLRQTTTRLARNASTKASSVNGKGFLEPLYQTLFKKNVVYVTTVLAAAVVVEAVYGSTTTYIWESSNRGRLYEHIDWTKFKTDDDDEEEDDE